MVISFIFPTHVGVNRVILSLIAGLAYFPHACGGEPAITFIPKSKLVFSPRMWG